jgi:hypothetical protein
LTRNRVEHEGCMQRREEVRLAVGMVERNRGARKSKRLLHKEPSWFNP